jgi:NAD(P)H dehydrogenase (quinone)
MAKILVLFHSITGHVYNMAESVSVGALSVSGCEVDLRRVQETLSEDIIKKMGGSEMREKFENIPIANPEDLGKYDAIIFGTPTRFGNMTAQMRAFFDATGGAWMNGELVGKVGSVFTSTATQHGGQESTILSTHITLLHHGMILVGLPYSFQGQMTIDEISGGSPYGASTIAGPKGERSPSKNELEAAKFQGKHVAEIAKKLFG